jgi:hypothetical protein
MVFLVADIDAIIAKAIHCQAVGVIELAVGWACNAKDVEQFSLASESLYAVFVTGSDHGSIAVQLNATRFYELSRLGTTSSPGPEQTGQGLFCAASAVTR